MSDFETMVTASLLPTLMQARGTSVTYTPAGGEGASITAVVEPYREEEIEDEEGRTLMIDTEVLVALSDVAAAAAGDAVTISGETFNVGDVVERGPGWVRFACRRAERVERATSAPYRRRR